MDRYESVRHQCDSGSLGPWNRRRVVLALSAISLALCSEIEGAAASESRALLSAADQSKLRRLLSVDEMRILSYASLAPSGHNAQPWVVRVIEPGHWTIGTNRQHWLPAVDPANRETTLSVGAFLENLIVAAGQFGYSVEYKVVAGSTAELVLVDLHLRKGSVVPYPIARLETRRTVRSGYHNDAIRNEDLRIVTDASADFIYFSRETKPARYLREATIEANRKQASRDVAQEELANWIRWSKSDQEKFRNGLTPAGMEITGVAGWYVRHFYNRDSVLSKGFREAGIKQVVERVAQGAGWLVLSGNSSVSGLIETGRKFQRMWLRLRERGIAIHPLTQILEETPDVTGVARELGIDGTPQFILRIGHVKNHPDPVSPRMPVPWFTEAA